MSEGKGALHKAEDGTGRAANDVLTAFRRFVESLDGFELARFLIDFDWSMEQRKLEPSVVPCLRYVREAAGLADGEAGNLMQVLADNAPALRWGQTYTAEDFGDDFLANYGWVELFGIRGHFANERMAGGFLVLGPNVHYPDHHHVAEEIYAPLTGGALWRMGGEDFSRRDAGAVIHHRSNIPHAMRTGTEPLVALYLWRGGPLAEKSTID